MKRELKYISCDELLDSLRSIYKEKGFRNIKSDEEMSEEAIAFNSISYTLLYILKQNDRLCERCNAWFQILDEKMTELKNRKT